MLVKAFPQGALGTMNSDERLPLHIALAEDADMEVAMILLRADPGRFVGKHLVLHECSIRGLASFVCAQFEIVTTHRQR